MTLRPSALRARLRFALPLALALGASTAFLFTLGTPATGGPQLAAPVSLSPNCQVVSGELPNLCPSTPTNASDGTHHPHLQVRLSGERRYHFDSVIWNAGGAFQIEGINCNDDGCSNVEQRIWEGDGSRGGASRVEDVPNGRLIVETGDGHDHYHYENATLYELIRPGLDNVPIAKIGFCMLDTFENRNGAIPPSDYPQGSGTCSLRSGTVVMGISRGWGDYYSLTLPKQWIVVTDVAAGVYTLRSTVNPGNEFIEASYDDNVLEETREIPGATAADVGVGTGVNERVDAELRGTVEGRSVRVFFEDGPSHDGAGPGLDFEIVDGPSNGSLGGIDETGSATAEVEYRPDPGFAGTDTFTYRTRDDRGLDSLVATVTVTVGEGSAPPASPPVPPDEQPATPPAGATPPPEGGEPPLTELPTATTKPARRSVTGTNLADILEGTRLPEIFRGFAGPDQINGRGGHDLAHGGRGRDTMKLGNGHDTGYGGKGKDKLMLGNGADVGYGGRGSDLIFGGNGPDTLYGGRGGDTLMIRDGKPDTADCGLGLDRVVADPVDIIDESCEIVELPADEGLDASDGAAAPLDAGK